MHLPLVDNELPDIFHLAAEGRHGPSPGLHSVRDAGRAVLSSRDEMEAEITGYFMALFHGCHVGSVNGQPVDSGATFQPDESLYPGFLEALPSMDPDQRDGLEKPLMLHELEAAVLGAEANKSLELDGLSYQL